MAQGLPSGNRFSTRVVESVQIVALGLLAGSRVFALQRRDSVVFLKKTRSFANHLLIWVAVKELNVSYHGGDI